MPDSHTITARDYQTGRWLGIDIDGSVFGDVASCEGPEAFHDLDPWIAPALWDLQTNGRWGGSFSDGRLSVEQVARIVRAQAALGTAKLCPTLITASRDALMQGVHAIAEACDADPEINRRVLGIHLEGPWISPTDGYRGAHPREHVRDPDWEEFESLQRASGSRIVLVTLAPERRGAMAMIERLTAAGVVVAIGHSEADHDTIRAGVIAGLRLSTHLGNGIPAILPRHPNPLWWQAAEDGLMASFIADGRHIDPITLGVLMRAKTAARSILVSDASPLAAAPAGRYGPWEVLDDGAIVVAGTPYLAGSNLDLWRAIPAAVEAAGFTLAQAIDSATLRPARLLGRTPPAVETGEAADLIVFRCRTDDMASFELAASCVGGEWDFSMSVD
ncbi:MAG: N-acetylglucosamine-6-phosphate deacetylase [Planctomycetota bacterium]|nr:N-acetylglucosamine-6-phosphate deacetylase [Planctomycetota bacterium]